MGLYSYIMYVVLIGFVRSKTNVLFLVADDMRPELSCYTRSDAPSPIHPPMHTPNLDALADRSLLLKRAYVQQAICSPSRTSLLTGRRPDTTHVYDVHSYFREVGGNFTTIPEYFKLNGYISVGMGKIFQHGHASGHDDPISWSMPYYHAESHWETQEMSWKAVPDSLLKDKPLEDEQIAQQAFKTLQLFAKGGKYEDQPFFVAVGFHRPHLPFVFPESFLSYYPESSVQLPDNPYAPYKMPKVAWYKHNELRAYKDIEKLNVSGDINTTLPDSDVLALRRAYYSAVSWTDSLVGKVIKELNRLGLGNDTIISFFGDHGWQLGEHGAWCKHTNFELATHAPMMIHIPGLTDSGIVTEELTEFVDLFPTLVEAAGMKPLELCPYISNNVTICREGQSLLPLIQPSLQSTWKKASFSQYPRSLDQHVMGYTVRTDRYRYTEWPRFTYAPVYKPDWDKLYGVELYDHKFDPEENKNRASDAAYNDTVQQLRETLRAGWRAAIQSNSVNQDYSVLNRNIQKGESSRLTNVIVVCICVVCFYLFKSRIGRKQCKKIRIC